MGVALDAMNSKSLTLHHLRANRTSETLPPMSWKEKTIDKVVWRGSFTGAFHGEQFDWRNSQRERMVKLANSQEDRMMDVLVQKGRKLGRRQYTLKVLNERFLDVEPVGGAVQVSVASDDWRLLTSGFSGSSSPWYCCHTLIWL